ncbi:MAG TPA: S41 family peptidase, partial [Caulobacteraceae bacterium]
VSYNPNAPAGPGPAPRPGGPSSTGPGPARISPANSAEARGNYGFRRVEVLPGNIGLIELRGFSNINFDDPDDPARHAADAALEFVSGTDALIFDLRDNGGGAPSMVGYLTSAFTPAGAPIYNVFHRRDGTRSEAPAVLHPAPRLTVPVYILTSGRTGSAAEAFPYTMQAAGRATIVGEASGGAANPGGTIQVGGGFAVFISNGSPRNPITGTNWEGTGVIPDVDVRWDQALIRAQTLALSALVEADASRRDALWAMEALKPPVETGDLRDYVGAYDDMTVSVVDGRLHVVSGRRPPSVLSPIGPDLFTVAGDPGMRIRFSRDGDRVSALDIQALTWPGRRARRTD